MWKNEKFSITEKKFRQINYLVIVNSLVKPLLSRTFCEKSVREFLQFPHCSNCEILYHAIFIVKSIQIWFTLTEVLRKKVLLSYYCKISWNQRVFINLMHSNMFSRNFFKWCISNFSKLFVQYWICWCHRMFTKFIENSLILVLYYCKRRIPATRC